jgi:hypothetical protein
MADNGMSQTPDGRKGAGMNIIVRGAALFALFGCLQITASGAGNTPPNRCDKKQEQMLLEQMAAFAGTSLQAKSEFISNNFPNAKVSDGVKRDVFEYNWIANAAVDKMMENNSFNDALHAWAKTIGKTCGQVREIIFGVAGGNYVRSSFRTDEFSSLCRRSGNQRMQCD